MRSTDDLVTSVRADTRNSDVPDGTTSTIGIPTDDIVRFLNYGQERAQSIILKSNPGLFRESSSLTLVSGQEGYTIADRIYAQERIVNVQIDRTGVGTEYVDLPEKGIQYRKSVSGDPTYYIRSGNGAVWLNPVPNSTTPLVRVTYERQLDSLAIRNGTVSGTPSGTSIVLSSPTATQEALFAANTFICVSDYEGNVMLRNARISSYNAGADTITLAANVSTYLVGSYTLASLASAYVTLGKYTTTHSKLGDNYERYLQSYGCMKVLGRDSSADISAYLVELSDIEKEMKETFQDNTRDEGDIQIYNEDLILNDGY